MTTVGIIGAGPSGLAMAKAAIEEGMTPVVFEAGASVGGLWRGGTTDHAWEGMRTLLSRWSCMFSDYPWPDTAETFPTQKAIAGYLEGYSQHFGLADHIRLKTRVLRAEPMNTGWQILTDRHGLQSVNHLDKLVVASGFFSRGFTPEIAGQFRGRVMHAAEFNGPVGHERKKVAVIGGSYSGYEIAATLAQAGVEVTHIMRHPQWVLTREVGPEKTPLDLAFYQRKARDPDITPYEANRLRARFFNATFGNPGEAHPDLAMPVDSPNPVFAVVSDHYLEMVRQGNIAVQVTGVSHLKNANIHLQNDRTVTADTLIFATGYSPRLDYFSTDTKNCLGFDGRDSFMPLLLHKATFPDATNTLGFVGFYRGPFFATMELQARWLAGVMSGALPAPTTEEKARGLKEAQALRHQWPQHQFPYPDYIGLADYFAAQAGVMPDPAPAAPVIPAIYRLQGRHAKPDIAQSIIASLPVQGIKPA